MIIPSQRYAVQEDVYFNDGRETELLQSILAQENLEELRGSPERVLQAIDEFGSRRYLMNVGKEKGEIVTDLIAKHQPETMVELGGYVGYSAILFGDALRKAGGRRYWSLEANEEFASIIRSLVDLAGLGDIVKVMVGLSHDSLRKLRTEEWVNKVDMLFLDHVKPAYLPDLKLCEDLGLIQEESMLVADNVIKPGNPPYLEYVRSSSDEKRERAKQHAGEGPRGNPELDYQSHLVESFEPTGIPDGVEVTRCTGLSW